MIFEYFHAWDEEKLGLAGGIFFVLLGVFAYLIYILRPPIEIIVLAILIVVLSALTSLFFQLPRIRGIKPGVSTFVGGITLGLSIIFWGYLLFLIPPDSWAKMGELAGLTMGLLISAFFGFGFLILALTPPESNPIVPDKKGKAVKRGVKEFKEDDDFIDRL